MQKYWVYIATNRINTVLYTGVTNNIELRMQQHTSWRTKSFAARYSISKLVYFDSFSNPIDAIAAEKKIKGWTRAKKEALILSKNPTLTDLRGELGRDSSQAQNDSQRA